MILKITASHEYDVARQKKTSVYLVTLASECITTSMPISIQLWKKRNVGFVLNTTALFIYSYLFCSTL